MLKAKSPYKLFRLSVGNTESQPFFFHVQFNVWAIRFFISNLIIYEREKQTMKISYESAVLFPLCLFSLKIAFKTRFEAKLA